MKHYAKLIDEHTLDYAPRTITRNRIHYNPYPVELMLADGYKPVYIPPAPKEDGMVAVFDGYEETDTIIKQKWRLEPAPEPEAMPEDYENALEVFGV